mgnify:CR=1 FL=1
MIKRASILAVVGLLALGTLMLFTYGVVKIDWISLHGYVKQTATCRPGKKLKTVFLFCARPTVPLFM